MPRIFSGRKPFLNTMIGLGICIGFAATLNGQGESRHSEKEGLSAGIVWYGSLNDGLEVAKKTQRPIFLLSAAPSCSGVPGVW